MPKTVAKKPTKKGKYFFNAWPHLNKLTASPARGEADLQSHVDTASRRWVKDENWVEKMFNNLMIDQEEIFD